MIKYFIVGPLPPPVHGLSSMTEKMANLFSLYGEIHVFDTKPSGLSGSIRVLLSFISKILRYDGKLIVYIALSGGLRQYIDLLYILLSKFLKRSVFIHHHSFSYLSKMPLHARLIFYFSRSSKHIVLCDTMSSLLSSMYKVHPKNIYVISNCSLLNMSNVEARNIKSKNDKIILGFLSNITREKGIFLYLSLLKKLSDSHDSRFSGLIAGPVDASIKSQFFHEIGRLDNVSYVGPVYDDSKRQFFNDIDFLIFPTMYLNEAEPVTILEAFSQSVPVLSINRGCIQSFYDNDNPPGVLFIDPEKFVDQSFYFLSKLSFDQLQLLKNNASCFFNAHQRRNNQYLQRFIDDVSN